MRLKQANREFVNGYFSTHQRGEKTLSAYASDLEQFVEFAGKNRELRSVKGPVIERWAAHLKQQEYAPASDPEKNRCLKSILFVLGAPRRAEGIAFLAGEDQFWPHSAVAANADGNRNAGAYVAGAAERFSAAA